MEVSSSRFAALVRCTHRLSRMLLEGRYYARDDLLPLHITVVAIDSMAGRTKNKVEQSASRRHVEECTDHVRFVASTASTTLDPDK